MPREEDKVIQANRACEEGHYEEAVRLYTLCLEQHPTSSGAAMVLCNRSAVHLLCGDAQRALTDAESAIRLQPTWSKGYLRKGLALQHQHSSIPSIKCFAKGLAIDPHNDQLLTAFVQSVTQTPLRDQFSGTQRQLRKLGIDGDSFVMLCAVGQELLSSCHYTTALDVLLCADQIGTDNLRLKGSLMSALASAHWKLGHSSEAVGCMEEDLAICRALGDRQGECRALANLGSASFSMRRYEEALEHHKAQLILGTDVKSRRQARLALGSLGHCYSALGELDQALTCHQQCVDLAEEAGDKVSLAQEYGNIGGVHLALGQPARALTFYEEQLTLAQELDHPGLISQALLSVASTQQSLGHHADALHGYQELLKSKGCSRRVEMKVYAGLATVHRALDRTSEALAYQQQHLELALKLRDNTAISKAYCSIGSLSQELGLLQEALAAHKKHLVKALEMRDRAAEGRVYGNLGNIHCAMGHYNKAIKLHHQALSIAVEEGDTVSQALTNGNLGIAFQSLGDAVSALQHLDTHLAIARECGDMDAQIKGLGNLGSFYLAREDFPTALELFAEQLDLAKEKGDVQAQCKALHSTAEVHRVQGSASQAIPYLEEAVSLSGSKERLLAKNLSSLATAYLATGQFTEAKRRLETTPLGPEDRFTVLGDLALACLYTGHLSTARHHFTTLVERSTHNAVDGYAGLGRLALQAGAYEDSKDHFEAALALAREGRLVRKEFSLLLLLSRALSALHLFEDAHSALTSASDLLPSSPQKPLRAELAGAFAELSLAKGDHGDALRHYERQAGLLAGEARVQAEVGVARCLWLEGHARPAMDLLDSLRPVTDLVRCEVLGLRCTALQSCSGLTEAAEEASEQHLSLSLGNKLLEIGALAAASEFYQRQGRAQQALVHYDQCLMAAREAEHVPATCAALLGVARAYCALAEHGPALRHLDEVAALASEPAPGLVRARGQGLLIRARVLLELGRPGDAEPPSRECVEMSRCEPVTLALATSTLARSLREQGSSGPETVSETLAACSRVEGLLLQRSLEFCYSDLNETQERNYSALLELQKEPIHKLWVFERRLRWERARYIQPLSTLPTLNNVLLQQLCSGLDRPDSLCVAVCREQDSLHLWTINGAKGLISYSCSNDAEFGQLLEGVLTPEIGTVYLVTSQEEGERWRSEVREHSPHLTVSMCGCLADLTSTPTEKSREPAVVVGAEGAEKLTGCVVLSEGEVVERSGHLHCLHLPASLPSLSVLDPLFVGAVAADCVFLYYQPETIPKCKLEVICRALLGGAVQSVVAVEGTLSQEKIDIYSSRIIRGSFQVWPGSLCYGADWTLRPADWRAGFRLVLRTTPDIPTSTVASQLLDTMDAGTPFPDPATLGWEEVMEGGPSARSLISLLSRSPHLDLSGVGGPGEGTLLQTLSELREEGRAVVPRDTFLHSSSFLKSLGVTERPSEGVGSKVLLVAGPSLEELSTALHVLQSIFGEGTEEGGSCTDHLQPGENETNDDVVGTIDI